MTKEEMIEKALNEDIDLTREEYAEKKERADKITAAHGVEGDAPLTEDERERRMRMNYYGSVLNVGMAILAALDDIANRITTLNNNFVNLAGGGATDDERSTRDSTTGD